ncbi:MAG: XrtV sorting system accessory protein [Phenylobacterium sp.]
MRASPFDRTGRLADNGAAQDWRRRWVETVYDWITVAIFGGLVVLFLHRSVQPEEPQDTILHYLPPAVGCAVANYVGNEGYGLYSFLIVLVVVAYVVLVLKPFGIKFWR